MLETDWAILDAPCYMKRGAFPATMRPKSGGLRAKHMKLKFLTIKIKNSMTLQLYMLIFKNYVNKTLFSQNFLTANFKTGFLKKGISASDNLPYVSGEVSP